MPKASAPRQATLPELGDKRASTSDYLETELAWFALIAAKRNRRNAEILISRWGLDGKGGVTLQEAGDRFGLTRERVRQIEARARKLVSARDIKLPMLDKALAIIAASGIDTVARVEERLKESGVSRKAFRIDGILEMAKLQSRDVDFELTTLREIRLIGPPKVRSICSRLLSECKRRASKIGVVNVLDLSDSTGHRFGVSVPIEATRRIVGQLKGCSWLDAERDWLWFPASPRNRLRNQVWKVLSVANGLPVSELREAVGRWHRMQGFAPPKAILSELCNQLSGVSVLNGCVTSTSPPRPEDVLGSVERAFVEIFRDHGGIMRRSDLEAACVARGVNLSSFYVYLGYSSLIEKLGVGVYALRGSKVQPGQVDELRASVKRSGSLVDSGWTDDARVWIGYSMSHSTLVSGVVSIPSGLKEVLEGEYTLVAPDRQVFGPLRCSDGQAWSLSKFWRRRGGEDGDPFLLIFDLVERRVTVYLGIDSIEELGSGEDPSDNDLDELN